MTTGTRHIFPEAKHGSDYLGTVRKAGGRMPPLSAVRADPEQGSRTGRPERSADADRRGPRTGGGRGRAGLCRPGRPAADPDAGSHRAAQGTGVHLQCGEMPSAAQPGPVAGRGGGLPDSPADADVPGQAEGDCPAGQHGGKVPAESGNPDHQGTGHLDRKKRHLDDAYLPSVRAEELGLYPDLYGSGNET